jgi:mono/diheme cytochrome c family protein
MMAFAERRTMHALTVVLFAAVAVFGGCATAAAQNIENGRRAAERRCLSCHAVSDAQSKVVRPRSLESIANTDNVGFATIAAFLRMPHGRMPNLPLKQTEIEDIAAYIAQMKHAPPK